MSSPSQAQARPLVTFALLAYNQEGFVGKAIQGALAQTYSPLEVILSDDCSTDATLQVIEEMAGRYRGPHEVIVRKGAINLGTALHVQSIAEQMSGELMVIAAGDDVSRPDRVQRIVEAWLETDRTAVVLHSRAMALQPGETAPTSLVELRVAEGEVVDAEWFIRHQRNPLLSPTAAYARCLFTDFPPLLGGSIIEDGPLVLRGFMRGRFVALAEPLVIQRKLPESSGTGYNAKDTVRWNRFIRSKIISQFNKIQDLPYARVSKRQRRILERRFHADLRGLSRCVFRPDTVKSIGGRLWMFLTILLNYPNTYTFRARIGFALKFSNLIDERASFGRAGPSSRSVGPPSERR